MLFRSGHIVLSVLVFSGMFTAYTYLADILERLGGFEANISAKETLEKLGFNLSFSEHYFENDIFFSASIDSRVSDLHQAFADESVHAILATIGGSNSNELLPYLDYDLIQQHPKIICGYSDTTAILNAIFAKTGMSHRHVKYWPALSNVQPRLIVF